MKEKKLEISLLTNATSVKELDELQEVQLIVFGPETHRQMIIEYNRMIADYGTVYNSIRAKTDELCELQAASGLARLFKGKKIDERIADLEREIEETEKDKKGLDITVDEALKCIQRFEEEMKEAAKSVLLKYGLTADEFINAYNKAKREIIQSTKNTNKTEESAKPSQRGE